MAGRDSCPDPERKQMKKENQKPRPEGDARERLLKAALELFTQSGYAATSVREIVEKAGVTKPVLYYYFKNKEGIYSEIVKTRFTDLDELFDYYLNYPGKVRERLLNLFDRILEFVVENREFVKLMHAIYYGPPQGSPYFDFEAYRKSLHAFISSMVEEGVRTGEFREQSAFDTAQIILAVAHASVDDQIIEQEAMMNRDDSRRIMGVVLDEIAMKKKRAGK
jgi:AcrR family transcriptional regulator